MGSCMTSLSEVVSRPRCGARTHGEKSVPTIGGGGDTTIPSPGKTPKQPLPGMGLHDPLHGRQACPKFNSFHQRVGQISPPEGLFSCSLLPKRGQICYIPAPPPQSLNDSKRVHKMNNDEIPLIYVSRVDKMRLDSILLGETYTRIPLFQLFLSSRSLVRRALLSSQAV